MEPSENDSLARGSLAGSEEVLVVPGEPRRGSNSRAFKVAGLTTLACLLLASQVFTAYMVFNQKQQIHTIQKSNEKLGKQLTRSSQAPMRMALPSRNMMLMDVALDEDLEKPKTPMTKLQNTAVVSVEKQLTDLMQDFELPHFNETFLANLQSLKKQMNESEWKSLESWMRNWLIFQMAQQTPPPPKAASTAPPTASSVKTKCQLEATPGGSKIGDYRAQCDEQGNYMPMQCWHSTGFCWCVDESGTAIEGTSMRGRPDCQRGRAPALRMARPMLIQSISVDDK